MNYWGISIKVIAFIGFVLGEMMRDVGIAANGQRHMEAKKRKLIEVLVDILKSVDAGLSENAIVLTDSQLSITTPRAHKDALKMKLTEIGISAFREIVEKRTLTFYFEKEALTAKIEENKLHLGGLLQSLQKDHSSYYEEIPAKNKMIFVASERQENVIIARLKKLGITKLMSKEDTDQVATLTYLIKLDELFVQFLTKQDSQNLSISEVTKLGL